MWPHAGPGRPKGSKNKTKLPVSELARKFLESDEYYTSLKARLLEGRAQQIETLLWYYAYGKPIDRIHLIGPMAQEIHRLADLYGMTPEDVLAEAEAIAQGRDG